MYKLGLSYHLWTWKVLAKTIHCWTVSEKGKFSGDHIFSWEWTTVGLWSSAVFYLQGVSSCHMLVRGHSWLFDCKREENVGGSRPVANVHCAKTNLLPEWSLMLGFFSLSPPPRDTYRITLILHSFREAFLIEWMTWIMNLIASTKVTISLTN